MPPLADLCRFSGQLQPQIEAEGEKSHFSTALLRSLNTSARIQNPVGIRQGSE